MSNYESVRSAASQLPVDERLRLIDELASSVPDDRPPQLSDTWLREIARRSNEIDSGAVATEDWSDIRARLFAKHGDDGAT
jgi:putative addiction module component (TIGR02574 family)